MGRDRFLSINGNLPFPGGISLTSIMWLKQHHPSLYRRTFRFGHLNTYLHRLFTGLGIDRGKLPRIAPSDEIITLTTDRPIPHEKVYLRTHAVRGRWLVLAITIGGGTLESTRDDLLSALLTGIFEPLHLVLDLYGKQLPLQREVVLTGGMVNSAYLEFKRRQFPRFTFRRVDECSTLGNARMALAALHR